MSMFHKKLLAKPLSHRVVNRRAWIWGALLLTQSACFDPGMDGDTGTSGPPSDDDSSTDRPDPTASMSGMSSMSGDDTDTSDETDGPDTNDTVDPTDTESDTENDPSSSDDSSETEDSGTPGCAAGTMCLAVPEGWNGPIAAHDADGAVAAPWCAEDYSVASLLAYSGLAASAAVCGCECDAPVDVECPSPTLTEYDDQTNCTIQAPDATFDLADGCNELGFFDDVLMRLNIPDPDLGAVSCTPNATESVSAVVWDRQVAGCGLGESPAACDAGSCIPTPDEGALCVWLDGDQACPAGDFSERQLIHRDVDDSRVCSACTCGDAEGSCPGTMTLYAGVACSAGSPGDGGDGDCVGVDTPARSVRYLPEPADISCAPSNSSPIGSATPTDAVTLCCIAG
jgi:hypothetical protein